MKDERFASGLAIIRYLSSFRPNTEPSIILTAMNLLSSFRKIRPEADYFSALIACYHLTTNIFEQARSILWIRKFLTGSPISEEMRKHYAVLGKTDPERQINSTCMDKAIQNSELLIIASLAFKFQKIEPEILISQYLRRTFSWFHPDASSRVSATMMKDCFRSTLKLLHQVIFVPNSYCFDA